MARAEHRGRHPQTREEGTERGEAEREAQEEERDERELKSSGGAAPYGYRSPSHAYSLRDGHHSEEAYDFPARRHFNHMHRFTGRPGYGPEYDENGRIRDEKAYGLYGQKEYRPKDEGGPEYGTGPEEQAGPEPRTTGVDQMSINSPSALDSWHGYGVDCPDLYDRE